MAENILITLNYILQHTYIPFEPYLLKKDLFFISDKPKCYLPIASACFIVQCHFYNVDTNNTIILFYRSSDTT